VTRPQTRGMQRGEWIGGPFDPIYLSAVPDALQWLMQNRRLYAATLVRTGECNRQ
jgi:hypothetical protein